MSANPFEADGVWLRCALHAHTTESDGDLPPLELAAAYDAAGYDVLAITDHWRLTRVPSTRGLLAVPAAELSCDLGGEGEVADVLVYGLDEVPDDPGGDRHNWLVNEVEHWEQRTFAEPARRPRSRTTRAALPSSPIPYWTGIDPAALDGAGRLDGLEVYNAGCEHESGRGDSSAFWDALLERGLSPAALAADDAHVASTDIGHAATWVRAVDRSPAAVVEALRRGSSYATSGPLLHDVQLDGARIEVACSPCRLVVVQMERELGCAVTARDGEQPYGRVLDRDDDGLIVRAELRPPDGRYRRVRAVDAAGRSAWTNVLV